MRFTLARACAMLLALAALPSIVHAQTVLFSDRFEIAETTFAPGPLTSNVGWTFVNDEANQSDARFGYDYSTIGIPEAPNSEPGDAATLGVALRTNVSAGAVDQGGVYYDDASFTGSYRVEVDMWLNWANDAEQIGTTEHAGLFVGKDTVSNPANSDFPASTGAGAIFSSDGDCSNCDHILLKNSAELDIFSGQYSVSLFDLTPNNQNPGNQSGYDNTDVNTDPLNGDLVDLATTLPEFTIPNSTDTQTAGTVGFRWVTLTADVNTTALGAGEGPDLGTTTFTLTEAITGNSFVLGTVDNSVMDNRDDDGNEVECEAGGEDICTDEAPVDMSGRVSLTLIDFFTSVASDINLATAVFDNLVVTEIEQALAGDYNDDGVVDAADYTVWRDGGPLSNETASPGVVDQADYDAWSANYGASAAAAAATAVPEPTALLLACLAAGALASRRRIG